VLMSSIKKRIFSSRWAFFGCLVCVLSSAADFSLAADFVVDSTLDMSDANLNDGRCETASEVCSLRAAIEQSNILPGPDKVTIPAGEYVMTLDAVDEDEAAMGDWDITDDLLISGAGADQTLLNANGLDRVIDVHNSANVSVEKLTIVNGDSGSQGGGGIRINSSFTIIGATPVVLLKDLIIKNNSSSQTSGGGGGVFNSPHSILIFDNTLINNNYTAGSGGGIYVSGVAQFRNNTIVSLNNSDSFGGGIYTYNVNSNINKGSLRIQQTSIQKNYSAQSGGGLFGLGKIIITEGIISNNRAGTETGSSSIASGGGLALSQIDYVYFGNSTISENQSSFNGGGMTMMGSADAPLSKLINLTVNNNLAAYCGGGLDLTNIAIINHTTIDNNTSDVCGGGLHFGNDSTLTTSSTLKNSTIANNRVINSGSSTVKNASGGGLYFSAGSYNLANVTVSNNRVETQDLTGMRRGAGLFARSSSADTISILNSTFSYNVVPDGEGSIDTSFSSGVLTTEASIFSRENASLAGNQTVTGSNCKGANSSPVNQRIQTKGYNVADDASCNLDSLQNDLPSKDPLLKPLAANGGLGLTHEPDVGSPALNIVPYILCNTQSDQRNFERLHD